LLIFNSINHVSAIDVEYTIFGQYFSYIMAVSFIGEGTGVPADKLYHIMLYAVHITTELTTLVVIGTD
jgi:hypothetical protein